MVKTELNQLFTGKKIGESERDKGYPNHSTTEEVLTIHFEIFVFVLSETLNSLDFILRCWCK